MASCSTWRTQFDLTAYWHLWEDEPDDTTKVYGTMLADDVVEVYSPPRVVAAAARGLRAKALIDLKTGYDLNSTSDKMSVRELLHRRHPCLLLTSPPSTKFSPMQNIRQRPELLAEELPELIEHVNYSMDFQEDQLTHKASQCMNIQIRQHPGHSQKSRNVCLMMRSCS